MKYYKPNSPIKSMSPALVHDVDSIYNGEIEAFIGSWDSIEKCFVDVNFSWRLVDMKFLADNYTEIKKGEFESIAKNLLRMLYRRI